MGDVLGLRDRQRIIAVDQHDLACKAHEGQRITRRAADHSRTNDTHLHANSPESTSCERSVSPDTDAINHLCRQAWHIRVKCAWRRSSLSVLMASRIFKECHEDP
jgi:hypothetical protein